MNYFKFDEKHRCPICGMHLHFTGQINTADYFTCWNCEQKFKVEALTRINEDGNAEFNGYGEIKRETL